MVLRILLLYIFLVFTVELTAQEPVSINLTEKDGLPDNEIYSILEDGKGYIWIAGNKGLFRYNGRDFQVFTHPKKRGRSFFNLKLDGQGRVWCNNIAGQFFYTENDSLKLFADYKNIFKGSLKDFAFLEDNLILHLTSDSKKNVIAKANFQSKAIKKTSNDIFGTNIGIVYNNQLCYFDKDMYLNIFNGTRNVRTEHKIEFLPNSFTSYKSISNGFLFIRSNDVRINSDIYGYRDNKLRKYTLPETLKDVRIETVFETNDNYYFSTNKGIIQCTLIDNTFKIRNRFLEDTFVTNIIEDANKNLWVSTLNEGLFVIPNRQLFKINNQIGVSIIKRKNDSVSYIGTKDGQLYYLNTSNFTLKPHLIFCNVAIRGLDYDKKSTSLIVSTYNRLTLFDEITNTSTEWPVIPGLKSINFLDSGRILTSVSNGSYLVSENKRVKLYDGRSYKSIVSNKGQLVTLNVDGLKVYSKSGEFIEDVLHNNKPIFGFDLVESENGTLWVSTYDKGVIGIRNSQVIIELNTEYGLASNSINTLCADGEDLWISTEKGLQYYNANTKTLSTLTKQDGLDSYNIDQIETVGDHVVYSSNLGLFAFNKYQIFKERQLFQPYFTNVKIQEKDTVLASKYKLKQNESAIRFEFNSLGFQSDKFTEYQYQIKGQNDDWIKIEDGSDYVKFNTLPAGNFIFNLRSKNKFGKVFSDIQSINLSVVQPFYKTLWFAFLIFLVSLGMLWKYFSDKTKRLKRRQKIELEKAEISKNLVFSQLENLRSQMNPHFIFNALNSIQDYIIINEKRLARQYLVKFSKLIRIYLDHSRTSEVTLSEELKALNLYLELEKDRFDDNLQFEIEVDSILNPETVKVPSLLIQPYVENALKHGLLHKKKNKQLKVQFVKSQTEEVMVCAIEDNGIGRDASAKINKKRTKHKSFATTANQKRINLINVAKQTKLTVQTIDLYDNEDKPKGTKVLLKIPL